MLTCKAKISRVAPKWAKVGSQLGWPAAVVASALATVSGTRFLGTAPTPHPSRSPGSPQVPGHGSLDPPGSRQCTMSHLFPLPGCAGLPTARRSLLYSCWTPPCESPFLCSSQKVTVTNTAQPLCAKHCPRHISWIH